MIQLVKIRMRGKQCSVHMFTARCWRKDERKRLPLCLVIGIMLYTYWRMGVQMVDFKLKSSKRGIPDDNSIA